MKIIGTREEINYINRLILNDYDVECEECPVFEQCEGSDQESNQARCGNVIWDFIEVEEVTE